ncbi:MAG TPA: protein translocase subunit SecD [Phenylobacterium sp.]
MMTISRWKVLAVVAAIIFGVIFALPTVLPASARSSLPGFLPQKGLNLGLDLQGGVSLLLEVDTPALRAERLVNMVEDVRTVLRGEKILFSDLGEVAGGVSVRITNPADVSRAQRVLRNSVGAALPSGGRDVQVATADEQRLRLTFVEAALQAEASDAVDRSIEIIRRRVDKLGTREPSITRQGTNRIVIQAPGETDPARLRDVIGRTAKLTFQMVDESADPAAVAAGRIPPGSVVVTDDAGQPYVLRRRAVVSGEMLTDAYATYDQFNRPAVGFRFDGQGARRFGDATRQNVGKLFAIVLDDKVVSAPRIETPILGGQGQITGNFTTQEVNDLVLLLKAGALPAPLKVEAQQTVGAELGADAVQAGKVSTAVGFVAILVFMLLAYGLLFGGISVIALAVNGLLIVAAMSATQATLTLPGIAGLILTLAVAVDANVLIYERMRDEVRAGRPLITAMDAGFSRAMTTILDANITTLLAAMIMFFLGSGPVKGFAWTLSIGVVTSVFTAVFVTQVLLAWWYRTRRPKTLPIA